MEGEMMPQVKDRELSPIVDAVVRELARAREMHAPLHSPHEGYAVILEELDELKAEVWKRRQDPEFLRKEAIQVAAMAIRFVLDLCDGEGVPLGFEDNDPDGGHACEEMMALTGDGRN